MDKRLALGLQLVACVAAVAFIADEWSDHTLRARVREAIEARRYVPEPVATEVEPSAADVSSMHTQARSFLEGR